MIELSVKNYAPPAIPLAVSAPVKAKAVAFLATPPGWFGDWHPAPTKQFIFVPAGETAVEVSDGPTPEVIKTWRRENDEPDTLEIVLDQPIPLGEHTRFIINDGVATNTIDYSYILGDADGNGHIDLADVAVMQNCFGETNPTGWSRAFDFDDNNVVDLLDHRELIPVLTGPGG